MATLIPSLDTLRHSDITPGELEVAQLLQSKLSEKTIVWHEPLIPPGDVKPDFLIYNPNKGILVVEVKDWKIDAIQDCNNETCDVHTINGLRERKNPYKQVEKYGYAIKNKCVICKDLIYPNKKKNLIFPYGLIVIFSKIARKELNSKSYGNILGAKSYFCKDEIFQNIENQHFEDKLYSVLPFRLRKRLSSCKFNSFCQILNLSKPPNSSQQKQEKLKKEEEERKRIAAEEERKRIAAEEERKRIAAEEERKRIAAEEERKKKLLGIVTVGLIAFIFSGAGIGLNALFNSYSASQKLIPETASASSQNSDIALQADSITIGVLGSHKYYSGLVDYLRESLGTKVNIVLDGDGKTSYQEAKNQIATKEWDITFTLSPMISVAAKDNDYKWLGRMFIKYPPYYQSALFVKSDSPIQSIQDLSSTTSIALGDFNSASSFYMPTYDLFGKSLTVNRGNRGRTIREMVKNGTVDVGAAAYGDVITKDPDFRIIHLSRNIPGSGVYLSPNLSPSDRQKIKQVLLDAPAEVKKAANYGEASEIDYSNFRNIVSRVEEVMTCSDWEKNPVQLYCSEQNALFTKVNGVTRLDQNTIRLKAKGKDSKNYTLLVSPQILNLVPGAGSALNLQNKKIKLIDVTPRKLSDGRLQIDVTQPNQIRVIN